MKRLSILLTAALLVAGFQPVATAETLRPLPDPLYGWTTDDGWHPTRITEAAKRMSRMSIVRIVFDEWQKASDYLPTVKAVQPYAYVMGELLDSYYVPRYSVSQYAARTTEYLNSMGSLVDIWEIANEVNGEWLGSTSDVVAKMSNAYDQVEARGLRSEVTLYSNPNCWERPENEMFTWAAKNIPDRMKQGLDYVLISYYEQDCNGQKFSQAYWQGVFDKLRQMFPNSKLGFGELGPRKSASFEKQREVMTRYYTMKITTLGYVGGYFWWTGYQTLTPWDRRPLFAVFNEVIRTY
jgi:hypothetical protein